jgi:PilZ domain-containing protein
MGSDEKVFAPRAPRFDLRTPVVLHLPEGIVKGYSVNVSESGMLAKFDRPVDIWAEGRLSADVGEWNLSINFRVARIEGRDTGLCFHIANEGDRKTIQKLIEYATQPPSATTAESHPSP